MTGFHLAGGDSPMPSRVPLKRLFRVASVGCGIQFGWALQFSLLTPYVQELGIPHAWTGLVWLCGPISGLLVQPLAGFMSDRCTSKFGRRSPFIVVGAALIVLGVLVIGHSADIGGLLGDDPAGKSRPWAIVAFVIGFWLLDVANNMTQSPCRALLADLTGGKDHRRTRIANAYYALFLATGSILGYAAGSFSGWWTIFPFTITSFCNINCANLKSAFLLHIAILLFTTCLSITAAQEVPLSSGSRLINSLEETEKQSDHAQEAFLWELFGSFSYLPLSVWTLLIVTAITHLGSFPFSLFNTDWVGREIYRGKPGDDQNYHIGVRIGALGLMLNSATLALTSLGVEKLCEKWGAGVIWGISNILMSFYFVSMLIMSYMTNHMDLSPDSLPPGGIVVAVLLLFALFGVPSAITATVPYAMMSAYAESLGLGQGLSMGVLNLAIVIPQVVVSLGSGPWDQIFGGGNCPAFALAAVAAFSAGLTAIFWLSDSHLEKGREWV